jgi:hypothetical protein
MQEWNVIGQLNDLSQCFNAGGVAANARRELGMMLRTKFYQLWNLTMPATPPAAPVDMFFCLPSDIQYEQMITRLKSSFMERFDTDLTADPAVASCYTRGCDVLKVGNGRCDAECNNDDCKWDGNDCGGPPSSNPLVDTSIPTQCRVVSADVNPQNQQFINFWEPCNGIGTCLTPLAAAPQCVCSSCTQKTGTTVPGNKCENCMPPQPCLVPGACRLSSSLYTGIQDRMDAWGGMMYDGLDVISPDRKSGVLWTTPAAQFDIGGVDALVRPLVQSTCAGELGATLLNGYLQAGIHAPNIQDMISFASQTVNSIQQCRVLGLVPAQPTLTPQQYEFRFMPHHFAFWLYQYTYFGQNYIRDTGTGFGPYQLSDFLGLGFANREPSPWPTPVSSPTPFPQFYEWSRVLRFNQFNSECSIFSAMDPTNRRCRAVYTGLSGLFRDLNNNPSTFNIHVDGRADVCSGAPTAHRPGWVTGFTPTPLPTLQPSQAAHALPAVSVYLESIVNALAANPRACTSNNDCLSFGANVYCVDIDRELLTMTEYYTGRQADPFSSFLFGAYNPDGRVCGGSESLRNSLRSALRRLAGLPRDTITAPTFCMYRPFTLVRQFSTWSATAYNPGTCAWRNYWDASRVCINTPAGGAYVAGTAVTINQINGPARDLFVPPVFSGVSPFRSNQRSPYRSTQTYTLSLPVVTSNDFDNSFKEHLRWVIATCLSRYNLPFSPDNVFIQSVVDNPTAFAPIPPTNRRAGVTIQFALELPDPSYGGNVTLQLSSNALGTLGSAAGALMAQYGVIPFASQREAVFRQVFPTNPGLDGLTLFIIIIASSGGIIFLSLIAHYCYLKPKGIKVPLVPSPETIGSCCCLTVRKVTGRGDGKFETITHSNVKLASGSTGTPKDAKEVKNPLQGDVSAAVAKNAAADKPKVVNVLNSKAVAAPIAAPAPTPAPVKEVELPVVSEVPAAAESNVVTNPFAAAVAAASSDSTPVETQSYEPTAVAAIEESAPSSEVVSESRAESGASEGTPTN